MLTIRRRSRLVFKFRRGADATGRGARARAAGTAGGWFTARCAALAAAPGAGRELSGFPAGLSRASGTPSPSQANASASSLRCHCIYFTVTVTEFACHGGAESRRRRRTGIMTRVTRTS
jgi:hypothetical protein